MTAPFPFLQEEEIQAAYDSAEEAVLRLVEQQVIIVNDYRSDAYRRIVRKVAVEVATAVIRSHAYESSGLSGDITDLVEVEIKVEKA